MDRPLSIFARASHNRFRSSQAVGGARFPLRIYVYKLCLFLVSISMVYARERRFTLTTAAVLAAGFLVGFLALNLSYAQNASAIEQPADSIQGTVINSVTHEPVSRALVCSPDNRFATMTDSQGHFEFKFPPGASKEADPDAGQRRPFELTARRPGFVESPLSTRNFVADSAARDITLTLVPESLIIGRVALPTSEVPGGTQVELYRRQIQDGFGRWVPAGSVSTKHDGGFRFADLTAGDYKLLTREVLDRDPSTFEPQAQLYGYPPVYYPNATDFASAKTITLTPGQTVDADISLVRQAYFPVKIAVTNAQPGTGVGVEVSSEGRHGPGYSLGYNHATQTIEGLLPNGAYRVEASSFGQTSATGSLTITVKGAPLEGPRMTLTPNGSISVIVKEEFSAQGNTGSGRGIRGSPRGPRGYLNVFLEPADDFGHERGGYLRPPTGPDDDSLIIESVQPGRYWVKVNSPIGFASSIRSGAIDLQHQPLVVGAGGLSSPIEITMHNDGALLDGTVEGADQSGVARNGSPAHVYLIPLPDSSGEFRDIWAGANGEFHPGVIPPGAYRVLAFAGPQPELEYRNSEAMSAYESKGIVIHLLAGQKERVRLPLISAGE